MKNLFFTFFLINALFSCEKETTNSNNSSTTETTSYASISGFYCSSVIIVGTLTKGQSASKVTATITYTGGNGKTFLTKSHPSNGVLGLQATLLADTLTNEEGTLVYIISGKPTSSGTANFTIALGDKNCTISINVGNDTQNPTIIKPGPSITDVEGNSYKTVFIGTQQWMGENLKVSKYSDGSIISNNWNCCTWQNTITGAWTYYNNDVNNNAKYGKLYNWYAVNKTTNGNKNICPTGWHVPTDAEWAVLTDYLGGTDVAGGKMKEVGTTEWNSSNTDATNASLFTGLPAGICDEYEFYQYIGDYCYWWSSSEYNIYNSWNRYLGFSNLAFRSNFDKGYGLSVRCLRD